MAWNTAAEAKTYYATLPGNRFSGASDTTITEYLNLAHLRIIYNKNYSLRGITDPNDDLKIAEAEYAYYLFQNKGQVRQELIEQGLKSFKVQSFSESYVSALEAKGLWEKPSTFPYLVREILKDYLVEYKYCVEIGRNYYGRDREGVTA